MKLIIIAPLQGDLNLQYCIAYQSSNNTGGYKALTAGRTEESFPSDSTGRKVSFKPLSGSAPKLTVISTTSQVMRDELEIEIPDGEDDFYRLEFIADGGL